MVYKDFKAVRSEILADLALSHTDPSQILSTNPYQHINRYNYSLLINKAELVEDNLQTPMRENIKRDPNLAPGVQNLFRAG